MPWYMQRFRRSATTWNANDKTTPKDGGEIQGIFGGYDIGNVLTF